MAIFRDRHYAFVEAAGHDWFLYEGTIGKPVFDYLAPGHIVEFEGLLNPPGNKGPRV